MGQRVVVDLVLDEQLEQTRETLVRQEHGDDCVSFGRDVAGRRRGIGRDPSEPVGDNLLKIAQILVLVAQARYLIRLARDVLLVCYPFAELARALGGLALALRELALLLLGFA